MHRAVEEEEEEVRRGQLEAGQLGQRLKGPSIGHRWLAQEQVVVLVEEAIQDLGLHRTFHRLIWPPIKRRPLAPSLTQ